MDMNMEDNNAKKSKNVAFQGVHESSQQEGEKSLAPKDLMALFWNKFSIILKEKGKFHRRNGQANETRFKPPRQ